MRSLLRQFLAYSGIGALCLILAVPAFAEQKHKRSASANSEPPVAVQPDNKNAPPGIHPSVGRFSSADGGATVHDNLLHVTWLKNANLAEKQTFGLAVSHDGSMSYKTALAWMSKLNDGAGYLNHTGWTLPTQPTHDPGCGTPGPAPNHNTFAFGCTGSSLGSLYYDETNLHIQPNETAVLIPDVNVGPFKNFQPYLYWSGTPAGKHKNGYSTFSFNTGWQGQNVSQHFMYVLPMIKGNPFGAPASSKTLQPVAGGDAVYDPVTDITWAADANLAVRGIIKMSGINRDGSMQQQTACAFVQELNRVHSPGSKTPGYLGKTGWQVPPAMQDGESCPSDWKPKTKPCGNFGCSDSPMGELFYKQFRLGQGQSVVATPDIMVGPFANVQPYLYWACQGGDSVRTQTCGASNDPANMAESYSFGNGFLGTDEQINYLYVTAYYPDAESAPPPPGPQPGKCSTPQQCCLLHGGIWSAGKCS